MTPHLNFSRECGLAHLADPIDESLHFLVASRILQDYHDRDTNPRNAQLIASTHSPELLDLIRPEQLHLVRRIPGRGTQITRADRIPHTGNDRPLSRLYRSGALEHLPAIG